MMLSLAQVVKSAADPAPPRLRVGFAAARGGRV